MIKTEPFGQNIADAIDRLRLDDEKLEDAYRHSLLKEGNPHMVSKSDVGLSNVDNTSDANKPISTATQTELNKKVDKVSGKSLVSDAEITRLASVEKVTANPIVTEDDTTLTSLQIGNSKYSIPSGGASTASDVEYFGNMLFSQDNVQDVLDFIAGDDKIENSTINVSTYSTGGGDASVRITSEYYGIDEVLNYAVAGADGKDYEFINVSYKGQYIGWTVTALRECYYNERKYYAEEVIDRWMYNSSKNMTIERRSKTTGNPLFVLSEEGKSLVPDSEIERLASVHNYDDTEIKEEIDKKADKSEVELVSTSTTSPILDSANGCIRDFEVFGKCEQGYLNGYQLMNDLNTYAFRSEKGRITITPSGNGLRLVNDTDNQDRIIGSIPFSAGTYTFSFDIAKDTAESSSVGWTAASFYLRTTDSGHYTMTKDVGEITNLSVYVNAHQTVEITNFMLENGDIAHDYEPYCGGIPSPNPSFPQEIKAWNGIIKTHGKNLLNNQNMIIGDSYQNNGITYTAQKPNMVHVKGTASENSYSVTGADSETLLTTTLKAGTYTQSTTSNNVNLFSRIKKNGTWETIYNTTFTLTEECPFVLRMQIPKGKTVDEDVYCMVEEGTQATDYVPFHESTADLGISLYGIKVSSGGNYTDENGQQWLCDKIDMSKGVIERRFGKVDLGRMNWRKETGTYVLNPYGYVFLSIDLSGHKVYGQEEFANAKCPYFSVASQVNTIRNDCDNTFSIASVLRVQCSQYTEENEFKSAMNGVELIYELDTPTTEQLTDAQLLALRQLKTYEDGTYVEYGGLEPFAEVGYWLGNKNGQVLAELDAKLNKILAVV